MPVYPGAKYRPLHGHTDGPMREHLGAVLHVNQSNGNLFGYFDRSDVEVSSHFEVYKNGSIEQYLDTDLTSWCQMDGNATYISIETEGYTTEPLTPAAVFAIGKLYRWLHDKHGIPFKIADHPGHRGFGWHGMGGEAWGGHFGCPGDLRKHQRHHILEIAEHGKIARPTPTPVASPAPVSQPGKHDDPGNTSRPRPRPHAASPYPYVLHTDGPGRPVYATAPGRFVQVDAATVRALIRCGQVDGKIHQLAPAALQRIRHVSIGRNS